MVSGGDVGSIAINSTSTRVVFVADRETNATNEMYSAPIGGGAVCKLSGTMVAGGDVQSGFKISADGARVVFRADKDTDEMFELYSAPIAMANATIKLSRTLVSGGDVVRQEGLFHYQLLAERLIIRGLKGNFG